MTSESQARNTRVAVAAIAATLTAAAYLGGVWAGSAQGNGQGQREPMRSVAVPVSYWSYDPETGNPTGPQRQPDFWNFDPETGRKLADTSPGVRPEALATLWSGRP